MMQSPKNASKASKKATFYKEKAFILGYRESLAWFFGVLRIDSGKKMADYKIVKYCRRCRKRFVVQKGQSAIIYCGDCEKIVRSEQK